MPKKVILKRRKLKIFAVVLFIVIVVLVCFFIKFLFGIKIQNIYVHHTDKQYNLSDEYILDKAKLEDYPSQIANFSLIIEKRLEDDVFIKDASVDKSLFGTVDIKIEENKVLFYKESDKKYVLEDGEEVDTVPYDLSPIVVVNYIPDTVYPNFVKKIGKLDLEIRNKISQIKYDPSEYDDSRFMLYMVDGNYVYATLTKFDSVNYYNEIYPTLNGKKGILYLDSGNHFQEIK